MSVLSRFRWGAHYLEQQGSPIPDLLRRLRRFLNIRQDNSDYYYFGGDSNPNVSYYPFLAYIDDAEGLSNNEWADLTIETNQGEDNSAFIWINAMYVLKMARVMYTRQEPETSWKNNM